MAAPPTKKYRITAPNGEIYTLVGPADASKDSVVRALVAKVPGSAKAPEKNVVEKTLGSTLYSVADIPLNVARGAVNTAKSITDVFGANNAVSSGLNTFEEFLGGLTSSWARQDERTTAALMREAEDKGFGAQAKAALQALKTAPLDLVSQGVGSIIPFIAGGELAAVAGGGAKAARAMGAAVGLGAASGAGTVKGTIYDTVKQKLEAAGTDPERAAQLASEAQRYNGKNIDQILFGTGLGALASATGAEKTIISGLFRGAGRETAEQLAAREAGKQVGKRGVVRTALEETGTEGLQGGQERLAQNIAEQREGFATPTWKGVGGQAALEGILGGIVGGGAGAYSGVGDYAAQEIQKEELGAAEQRAAQAETPEAAYSEMYPAYAKFMDPQSAQAAAILHVQRLQGGVGGAGGVGAGTTEGAGIDIAGDGTGVPGAGGQGEDTAGTEPTGEPVAGGVDAARVRPKRNNRTTGNVDATVAPAVVAETPPAEAELQAEVAAAAAPVSPAPSVKPRVAAMDAVKGAWGTIQNNYEPVGTEITDKAFGAAATQLLNKRKGEDPAVVLEDVLRKMKVAKVQPQAEVATVAPPAQEEATVAPPPPAAPPAQEANLAEALPTAPLSDMVPTNEAMDKALGTREPTTNMAAAKEEAAPTQVEPVEQARAAFVEPAPTPTPISRAKSAAARGVYSETEFREATGKKRNAAFKYYKGLTNSGVPVADALRDALAKYAPDSALTQEAAAAQEQQAVRETEQREASKLQVAAKPVRAQRQLSDRITAPADADADISANLNTAAEAIALAAAANKEPDSVTVGIAYDPTKPYKPYSLTLNGAKLRSNEEGAKVDVRASTPEAIVSKAERLQFKSVNGKWSAELAKRETDDTDLGADKRTAINTLYNTITQAMVEGNISRAEGNRLRKELEADITDAGLAEVREDFAAAKSKAAEATQARTTAEKEEANAKAALEVAENNLQATKRRKRGGVKAALEQRNAAKAAYDAARASRREAALSNPKIDRSLTEFLDEKVSGGPEVGRRDFLRGAVAVTGGFVFDGKLYATPAGLNSVLSESTTRGIRADSVMLWLANNSKNRVFKMFARKLAPMLQGVKVHTAVVDPVLGGTTYQGEDVTYIPDAISEGRAHGQFTIAPDGKEAIWLVKTDAASELDGWNESTVMHEGFHGGLVRFFGQLMIRGAGNPREVLLSEGYFREAMPRPEKAAQAIKELTSIWKEASNKWDAVKGTSKLSDFEKSRINNGLKNLDEFVSYAVTDESMQKFLRTIASAKGYKRNLFQRFADWVRSLFGAGSAPRTAVEDMIDAANSLVDSAYGQTVIPPNPDVSANPSLLSKKEQKEEKKAKESWGKTKAAQEGLRTASEEKIYTSNSAAEDEASSKDILKNISEMVANRSIAPLGSASSIMAMRSKVLRFVLQFYPMSSIVAWQKENIPELVKLSQFEEEFRGLQERYARYWGSLLDEVSEFTKKHGQTDLANAMHIARLESVDPTAFKTLAEALQKDFVVVEYNKLLANKNITPEDKKKYTKSVELRREHLTKVYKYWDALSAQEGGQELYVKVREYYRQMYFATRALLDKRIESLDIDASSKKQLMDQIRKDHELEAGTKSDVFPEIDASLFPTEYFPFNRYGQYWFVVKRAPGKNTVLQKEFYQFESATQRNRFMKKRAAELGQDWNNTDYFEHGDSLTDDIHNQFNPEAIMLTKMFSTIESVVDGAKFDTSSDASIAKSVDDFRKDLRDQLYQVYLLTAPERINRKQFIHSDNIAGFSPNILRNLQDSMQRHSRSLAKLEYSPKIETAINEAKAGLAGRKGDEKARLNLVINNMVERMRVSLYPDPKNGFGEAFDKLNQLTFVYLLSSSATAITQFTALPIRLAPRLMADHGTAKTTKAMFKWLKVWNKFSLSKERGTYRSWSTPSVVNSSYVRKNKYMHAAARREEEVGTFETLHSSIVGDRPTRYNTKGVINKAAAFWEKFIDVMGWMFRASERISREMAWASAWELEFNKLGGATGSEEQIQARADAASQYAKQVLGETLGLYNMSERPPVFTEKGPLGPVANSAFMFKHYAVVQTQFFLSAGYRAFGGGDFNKQERSRARKELAAVLLMIGLFSGIQGLPLYSLIASMLDLKDWYDGEDDDAKERLAEDPVSAFDSDAYFRRVWMPQKFGDTKVKGPDGKQHTLSDILLSGPISELSGINIGSRTSYDGLWLRDTMGGKKDDDSLGVVMDFVFTNIAPLSLLRGFSIGYNQIKDGDPRGWEKMFPAFVKGPMAASRLDRDGLVAGEDLLLPRSKMSDLALAGQLLGFQPEQVGELLKFKFKQTELVADLKDDRSKLMRELNKAAVDLNGDGIDPEAVAEAQRAIIEWNKTYGGVEELAIEDKDYVASYKAYVRERMGRYRGIEVPKGDDKLIDRIEEAAQ